MRLVYTIPLFLLLICCKASQKTTLSYCFKGDSYASLGHIYTLSKVEINADSTFVFADFLYSSRKDQNKNNHDKVEYFRGTVQHRNDTIKCIVSFPEQFAGNEFIFYSVRGKLFLLDNNRMSLQKWRRCDSGSPELTK